MQGNKDIYSKVAERYCSYVGGNVVVSLGEKGFTCLSSQLCSNQNNCKHSKERVTYK